MTAAAVAVAEPWTALVAFTTSNRATFVRRCLPHLAKACDADERLSLLVALDGDDADTRDLCRRWSVPLLFSEQREGVGLSKNRVLKRFPEYDYYFFIEDDMEVLDTALFERHVELMRAGNLHHMSLFAEAEGREPLGESSVLGERIVHFGYGSAEFNAFSSTGLHAVGGWHPLFAQYRRWGHTEHSYRFPRNALAPAPFNVAVDLASNCIRNRPPSVTAWAGEMTTDAHGIAAVERELMSEELTFVPLETIAPWHLDVEPPGHPQPLAALVAGRDRYPLLSGVERRQAQADFLVWRSETAPRAPQRGASLLAAAFVCPSNLALRHAVKMRLIRLLRRTPSPSHG